MFLQGLWQVLLPGVLWYWCLGEDREPNSGDREPNFSRADIYTYEDTNILYYHDVLVAQLVETLTYNTYTKLFCYFRVQTTSPHFRFVLFLLLPQFIVSHLFF